VGSGPVSHVADPAVRRTAAAALQGRGPTVNDSYPYDPELHEKGTQAAEGRCSYHGCDSPERGRCAGEAVVSFEDADGRWQAGCSLALEQLVDSGAIAPLGQGA
jgi:hypothetical protein